MPNIGPLEIVILLVVVLVIFGPKRLPELGKGLGKGMREFKDSITGKDNEPDELPSGSVQTSGQATAPPEHAAPAAQTPPPVPVAAPAPQPEATPAPERETARSGEPRG